MGIIRLLLALSVLLAHLPEPLPFVGRMVGGEVAVKCFFLLSGFYMAMILQQGDKYAKVCTFYRARLARIFSGYWVAIALALILVTISGVNPIAHMRASNIGLDAKVLSLFSNFFLFGSDLGVFLSASPHLTFTGSMGSLWQYALITPAWSLPVELGFYALAPFVVRSIPRMLMFAAASIAVRLLTYQAFGEVDPWTYRFMPNELAFFLAGTLAYRLLPYARTCRPWIGWVALAVSLTSIILYEALPVGWVIYPILALSAPFVIASVSNRVDTELGEASYMLYLVHVPLMSFMAIRFQIAPSASTLVPVALIAALALHQIAKPLDRRMRAFKPNTYGRNRAAFR